MFESMLALRVSHRSCEACCSWLLSSVQAFASERGRATLTWSMAWWPQWKLWATPLWWWPLCMTARLVVFSPHVVSPPPVLDVIWTLNMLKPINLLNQVVNIPEEVIESHDLTVDYILTPSRVIKTNCQNPKPQGIIWTKVKSINNLSIFCCCLSCILLCDFRCFFFFLNYIIDKSQDRVCQCDRINLV